MKVTKNVLTSSAVVKEGYNEFTTFFRIPHIEGDVPFCDRKALVYDVIGSWSEVLIKALNMRMDACVSMLFRNRDNVIKSNSDAVWFKKNNGHIHSFNFYSFDAMNNMIQDLSHGCWGRVLENKVGLCQLLKALYWIPEEDRKDRGFSFGELISCLEEAVFVNY